MPPNVLHLLFLLILATQSPSALAWGARGHRVIAQLAELQLTPRARAEIGVILGNEDLGSAATWADDMRNSADHQAFWLDYANAWHFVNLPANGSYQHSEKNPHGDAVAALAAFTAILQGQPLPDGPVQAGLQQYFGTGDLHSPQARRFALKFLIHVVGDLHQPLHSGYASDHGGNDIKLDWHGKTTNLHALWDSQLLEHEKLSEANLFKRLQSRIRNMPDADIRRLQSTDALQWLQESSELLAYIHSHLPAGAVVDNGYMTEFVPVVESQLVKAAVRTACVLNGLFDAGPDHER